MAGLAPRIGGGAGGLEPLVAGERPARGSVVVCAEPVVVYRPITGALAGVQHGGGVAARWSARCRGVGCGAGRCGGPPREPCARCSPRPAGYPSRWFCPCERADFGWQVIDASGWSESRLGEALEAASRRWFRPGNRDPVAGTAFPCRRRRACAGGRGAPYRRRRLVDRPRWCVIWVWRMPAGARDRPRAGRRWRCSMSITRCGSVSSWVISTIRDSPIAAQLALLGGGAGQAARARAAAHRSALSAGRRLCAAPRVAVDWPAELQQRVRAGGKRAPRDQFHGDPGRPGGAAGQAQRQQRCRRGFPIAGRARPGAR